MRNAAKRKIAATFISITRTPARLGGEGEGGERISEASNTYEDWADSYDPFLLIKFRYFISFRASIKQQISSFCYL